MERKTSEPTSPWVAHSSDVHLSPLGPDFAVESIVLPLTVDMLMVLVFHRDDPARLSSTSALSAQ